MPASTPLATGWPPAAPPLAPVPPIPAGPVPVVPAPESTVSVQSVLAVAGAGLVAVAALVFTFLNPDLTDLGTRAAIIGATTAVFLVGAVLLRRRDLTFSSEAIGALGVVFVGLDVWAVAQLLPTGLGGWAAAAVGAAAAGILLAAIGTLLRLRTWLWSGMLAIVVAPLIWGFSVSPALGRIGLQLAAFALATGWQLLALPRLRGRFGAMEADRTTATVVQVLLVVGVLPNLALLFFEGAGTAANAVAVVAGTLLALAALAAVASRAQLPGFWSFLTGMLTVGSFAIAPFSTRPGVDAAYLALVSAAAALALVLLTAAPSRVVARARLLDIGAFLAFGVAALQIVLAAAMQLATPLLGPVSAAGLDFGTSRPDDVAGTMDRVGIYSPAESLAAVIGLAAVALGVAVTARLLARTRAEAGAAVGPLTTVSTWLGAGALGAGALWTGFPLAAQVGALLAVSAAAAIALLVIPAIRRRRPALRAPLIALAHLGALLAACAAWADRSGSALPELAGAGAIVVLGLAAATVPAPLRALHVGVGYAYALAILASSLGDAGVGTLALLCLVTSAAAVVSLVATLLPRIPASWWFALLGVTAVPFLIGIGTVLTERSGWTALSTALIGGVALTLLLVRRRDPGLGVRAIAAALVIPSAAVAIISLGAQVLATSASPVTLPIIAVLVAAVLGGTGSIRQLLEARLPAAQLRPARAAIELSTYVTGAVAVLLALVREASGLGTACLVLLIGGLGAAASSVFARRRSGWWIAAGCWTAALWCVWGLAGVDVPEPYLLPPALGALAVGTLLVVRRRAGAALAATGLACAIVPTLVLLVTIGNGVGALAPWRTIGLLGASALLLAIGAAVRPGRGLRGRLARLQLPVLALSGVAAASAAVQGMRWGLGVDAAPVAGAPVMVPVLLLALGGALLVAAIGATLIRSSRALAAVSTVNAAIATSRWVLLAPVLMLALGPMTAVRRDWFAIWTLWVLMMALLILVLAIAMRTRRVPITTLMPPAAAVYAIAWVVGVVGWSPRDLRVEWFSLPLGLAVLAAGAVHFVIELRSGMRPAAPTPPTLSSWPAGFSGSPHLIAPGLVLTMLPSVVATGTDPQTWRAIFVIAVALVSILAGVALRLRSPFVLGIAALPLENVVVFASQLGRGVESLPWWITLATAGAVLLAIAVGSERRTNQGGGVAARLRELR
ncbi:hypothetical protein FJ658_06785 [Schumannella sp. 10F1B-5-1]|nr:hypothetical protein FJ658_06785 [Schumannella sp. 10F1B-5-1]